MINQKPFRGSQLNRTHPLAKGLIGCWLFNEMTGETVFDSSGNGNSGALKNGVAWSNDGLEFDGVNDYVGVGEGNGLFDFTNSFTISAWVKPNNGGIVASKWYDGAVPSWNFYATDTSVYFDWREAGAPSGTTTIEATGLAISNIWTHIAISYDGTTFKIYVNGVQIGTTSTRPTFAANNANLYIGKYSHPSLNYYFDGSIRFVCIYSRAQSAEEFAWIYREPYAMFNRSIEYPIEQ